jgi:HEAT repeat protein
MIGLGLLGIERSERRSVGLMTAHSFFMGCATVFFETAASATFLARFDAQMIPWVYVAAAGANLVTGSIYARVQKRASFADLMKGTLWFLLALVVTVRVGFSVSRVAWVAFAGLVSYRVISSLTDLEYWAVASRIYDVRQAKRLFGLIGTGEVVARIAGAFCVPFLVATGGVANLMLISAGALVVCLALLGRVLHLHAGAGPRSVAAVAATPATGIRSGLREITASPYLSVVVSVAVLATFGKYFVDFAFLEQMSTVSKGEVELASVLGVFSGLTQTLSLLTRVFVSRPLLARLGIRAGVLILPMLHALCTVLVIATGILGPSSLVFWLVIANQGIYKTFKHPIDNASFKVLYQPLRSEQRLAAQIAVEVIFAPVVVGVAGAVMLLFSSSARYDPVRFSFVLFVVFVAWVWTARAAGRGYAQKLVEMLRRRIEGEVVFGFDDATTAAVIRQRIANGDALEVCVALALLEKAAPNELADTLLEQTSHPSPEVRRYAIVRLLELRPESLRAIRKRISLDPVPSIRGVAMQVVGAGPAATATAELVPYLDDPDLSVRQAALTALFAVEGDEANRTAREAVSKLATSAAPPERAVAATIAGTYGLREPVVDLLADASFKVRRAALLAAGQLKDETLRPILHEHLLLPRFAQAAGLAIAAEGDAALESLDALFVETTPRLALTRLVYVHRLIGTPLAMRSLAKHIDFPEATVRTLVLLALDRLGYIAPEKDHERIAELVRSEAVDAVWTISARRDLGDDPPLDILRRALDEDVAQARRRILYLLGFVNDRVAVQRAALNLGSKRKENRAYAHEVFELMLTGDDRELVLPLVLETRAADGEAKPADGEAKPAAERLREIAERSPRSLRPWTRDVAGWAMDRRKNTPDRGALSPENEMLLIEKIIVLKTVPMFARTSEELVAEIASIVEIVDHRAGDVIFEKGDAGESMYIVVSGAVRVYDGATTLRVLGEREIFGELALLDPEPRSASIATTEDTRLFRLDGDLFTELMAANVDIVRGVLHVLCERLRVTSASARESA